MRSVKTHPKEMDGGIGHLVVVISPGGQSRLATDGTFGLRPALSASSSPLLPRQTHVAVPFSRLSYELNGRSLRTTYKRRVDVIFHCEESGFLAYRYHFSAGTPICLWGVRVVGRLHNVNIPKERFQKYRSPGRRSSWIGGYAESPLYPGDLGGQHRPDDPVVLAA